MSIKPIHIQIETDVTGEQDIKKLASTLDDLGNTLDGDLKVQAQQAARAIRELGSKQEAIANFSRLKTEVGGAADRLRDAQTAAQNLGKSLSTGAASTRAQAGQMEKLREAVRVAKTELQAKTRTLEQGRDTLRSYGIASTNLAAAERSVRQAIAATRGEVSAMVPTYSAAANAAAASGLKQTQTAQAVRSSLSGIGDQLRKIQSIAVVALGGSYFGGLLKDVADTADEFKNLEARVKLATGEGKNFERSFAAVQGIALETNTALDETGTLFARLTKASEEGGQSAEAAQERALRLTRTINQATQLSGGSVESAKAATTQLIQGLQSGVLRGEEFNSMMEQSPRLAQAMAAGLGVTTGQLRAMSKEGALTAETVMRALESQSDAVAAEFGKLPSTVGRALQNLSSQWTLYVGASDAGLLSSANAAKAIDALANNLDTLVDTLTMAGKIWAAMKIADLAAGFGTWAAKTLGATVAVEANTAATTGNTLAHRANAAAVAASAAAQGASAMAATRSTAFATAASAATSGLGRAAAAAVPSVGLLGRAVGGLSGLLGGPIGLVATTALFWPQIKSLGVWMGETAAKMAGYRDRSAEIAQADSIAADASKRLYDARTRQAEAEKKAAQAEQDRAKGLTEVAKALVSQYQELRQGGKDAADALAEVAKNADLKTSVGTHEFGAALREMKLNAEQLRTAFGAALQGADLEGFEQRAKAAFGGAKADAALLSAALDAGLREAIKRSGADFDVISGGMGKAAKSAISDTDTIIAGMGRLKSQGVDVGTALETSLSKAINTADGQKSVDELRKRIEAMRNTLGEKVADGLLSDLQKQAEKLGATFEKLPEKAENVATRTANAFRSLGIQTQAELKQVATETAKNYELVKASGQATADGLKEAWKKMAEASIAANGGVASETLKAGAAMHGLRIEADDTGRAIIKNMKDARDAVEGYAKGVAEAAAQLQRLKELQGFAGAGGDLSGVSTEDLKKAQADLLKEGGALSSTEYIKLRNELMGRGAPKTDANGFTLDKSGNTLAMGGELNTLTGIANFLKQAGLNDEQAKSVALEFSDGKGGIPYFSNPGQMKYGGQSSTISESLLKAAERTTFGLGSNGATAVGRRYVHDIRLDDAPHPVTTHDEESANNLESIIAQLTRDKRRAM